jgi:tetratricopeptide (TPR) repeat protein
LIDLKQEIQDYRNVNLKDITQNESEIPDNIRNSIILYNKALESLKNGSEDIAIIELKKATSMNPHFYEAMNLLGICYSYVNDNARAAEVFGKVIKAEQNSVKAMKYLSLLNLASDNGSVKLKTRKNMFNGRNQGEDGKAEVKPVNDKKTVMFNITRVLAGFVAGAIVISLINLVFPNPKETQGIPVNTDNISTKANKDIEEIQTRYDDLSKKYALLQKDKDEANQTIDYYKSVIKLYDIESLVLKKQYESAADMLLLMKTVDFREADKVKFDNLYKTVMPESAKILYDEGYKLYNVRNYEESLKKFDKVLIYDPAFNRADALFYYMGRCYQQLNDSRNAIAFFQKLIDNYPGSNYTKNAKVKVQTLIGNP